MPSIGFDMGGTSTDVSRFSGDYELIFDTQIAGVSIQAPQLDINTVAAGGGSRLFYQNSLFVVGPESAGANPGPVCYRKNGHLAITDANLILGRLLPNFFPKIFGPTEDQPLDMEATHSAFESMLESIRMSNEGVENSHTPESIYECAYGFIKVANEAMARPIRSLTQARGFDPRNHVLSTFGGAGGQHACAIARILGINNIFIHKQCGILSAYGMGLADVVQEKEEPANTLYSPAHMEEIIIPRLTHLAELNEQSLKK